MTQHNAVPKAVRDRDQELWTIASALGLKRYDSVRACVRCGSQERYVVNQGCVACANHRGRVLEAKRRKIGHALTRQEALDAKLPYFFPIHRCKHGHLSRWSTRRDQCMMCIKGGKSSTLHERMAAAEKLRDDLERLAAQSMTDDQILRLADA